MHGQQNIKYAYLGMYRFYSFDKNVPEDGIPVPKRVGDKYV